MTDNLEPAGLLVRRVFYFWWYSSVAKKLGLDFQSEIARRLRAHEIRKMFITTPAMMLVITAIQVYVLKTEDRPQLHLGDS